MHDWPKPFSCPICKAPLRPSFQRGNVTGAHCRTGHHFDRARQGYLNLLPVQHKASRAPGDSAAMVQARDLFLAAGWYRALAVQLGAIAESAIGRHSAASAPPQYVVDLGCGTGYYARFMPGDVVGVDVSTPAIKRAARSVAAHRFCVASTRRLPIMSGSCVLALALFAPFSETEAARILTPSGILLRVAPGPTHLRELRASLFETDEGHRPPAPIPGFELSTSCRLRLHMDLPTTDVAHLIEMTPMGWRSSSLSRDNATIQDKVVTADFLLETWRKPATVERRRTH